MIIDGGNSYYLDDIRRAASWSRGHPLRRRRHERRRVRPRARLLPDDRGRDGAGGAARADLQVARAREVEPRRRRDATGDTAEHGYLHCGPAGAGHFVKMVHNGIEYGLMAAYAEGLNVLHRPRRRGGGAGEPRRPRWPPRVLPLRLRPGGGHRGLAARQRRRVLAARPDRGGAVADPKLEAFGGRVSDSGEGRWTIQAAIDEGVPAPVLTAALYERFSSRGEALFADKLLSAMRSVRRSPRAAIGGGVAAVRDHPPLALDLASRDRRERLISPPQRHAGGDAAGAALPPSNDAR